MASSAVRLGRFVFDPATGELSEGGSVQRLRPQAARALAALVERPGELVTRSELGERVWPAGRVDADLGLNVCIRQIRSALGDDADEPAFIETLRGRGYRLVASVEPLEANSNGRSTVRWLAVAAVLGVGMLGVAVSSRMGTVPPAARIAVLPFGALGPEDSLDYMRQGLAEDVITTLARHDPTRLAVVARTSAFRFGTQDADARQAGAELDADYVVQGTIRQLPDGYRVTTRLLDMTTAAYVWSERFDLSAEALVDVDRTITRGVVDALADAGVPVLADAAAGRAPRNVDPRARDDVLRARYLLGQFTRDAARRAVAFLELALERDSTYADAFVELARARLMLGQVTQAEGALGQARMLDASASGVDHVAGTIAFHGRGDIEGSITLLARSVAREPGVAEVRHIYAQVLAANGRLEEAVDQGDVALELDPISSAVRGDIGWVLLYAGQYDDARDRCRSTLELRPQSQGARVCTLLAAHFSGVLAEEQEIARELLEVVGSPPDEVARVLDELDAGSPVALWSTLLSRGVQAGIGSVDRARLLALLGRHDEAMTALEAAAAGGRPHYWLDVDPVFATLPERNDVGEVLDPAR